MRKVFIAFAGFACIQVLILSAVSLTLAYVVEDKLIERILALEVERIENTYVDTGQVVEPRNTFVRLYLHASDAPQFVRDVYRETRKYREIFGSGGNKHYHIATLSLAGGLKPVLVADVTELLAVRDSSNEFYLLYWLVLAGSLIISFVFSFYLARYTTKPLVVLAKDVAGRDELNKHNLKRNNEDELAYLSRVISFSFEQVKETLDREQHFNRDLSHELRTPLTILKNTLSLSELRSLQQEELSQMSSSVESMVRTVDVLLTIARQGTVAKSEFSIKGLIEECVIALYPTIEKRAFQLDINVSDRVVSGNKALTQLVINNLIENAMAHSSDANISIESVDDTIVFANNATGALPPDPMSARSKGDTSAGLGQGLFLIKRILQCLGWHYTYTQNNGRFQFVISPSIK